MRSLCFLMLSGLVGMGAVHAQNSWTSGAYGNNVSTSQTLQISNASSLTISVVGETEKGYDFLSVYDQNGTRIATLSGSINYLGSAVGSSVLISFTSDHSIVKSGITVRISAGINSLTNAGSTAPVVAPTGGVPISTVTEIPSVMRSLGFSTGARWMDRWFNGNGTNLRVDINDIFRISAKARTASERWDNNSSLLTGDTIKTNLIERLRRYPSPGASSILLKGGNFDFIAAEPNSTPNQHQILEHEDATMNWIADTEFNELENYPPISDAIASIGKGVMRLVPSGSVVVRGNVAEITVTRLGVYFRDSYDFAGSQPLGCWGRNPPGVAYVLEPGKNCVFDWTFRNWRDQNARGSDYRIFSSMRDVPLGYPIVYKVDLPTRSVLPSDLINKCVVKFQGYFGQFSGATFSVNGYLVQFTTGGPFGAVVGIAVLSNADASNPLRVLYLFQDQWYPLPASDECS